MRRMRWSAGRWSAGRWAVGTAALALILSGTATTLASGAPITSAAGMSAATLHGRVVPAGTGSMQICPQVSAQLAHCTAIGLTVAPGSHVLYHTPELTAGLTPADIQAAYNLPANAGKGQTIAVIEAGDYKHIDSDLAVFRSQYDLSPCTEKNGCLQVVNQDGGSTLPPRRIGWSFETALDVDAVSAACPNCNILVVEANDSHRKNLAISNATAASMGAVAVSNSWKAPEFKGMDNPRFAKYFDNPGVAFMASSGDGGHTDQVTIGYPAGLTHVLAIGGTYLAQSSDKRGWTETAWSGAGSACGVYVKKPSWQKDKGCKMRSTSDVSADASPASGLAIYHTNPSGKGGWYVFGGTSLSSPLIAAIFGLAGNTKQLGAHIAQHLYANAKHLYDVTEGSNGTCPKQYTYICQAGPGYDGPTGLGTPHGVKAF